jgi:hypothetical protein
VALVAGTLALSSLSIAFTGVGTSPSNAAAESNQARKSGVASIYMNYNDVKGESTKDGGAGRIEILSFG